MSTPGTPKASPAAIAAVQEALGCYRSPDRVRPFRDVCLHHYRAQVGSLGEPGDTDATKWTERGCPVAVAAADAAAPHNAAQAWDEGHLTRWRRGPDNCHCNAWSAGECACGEYGSGELLSIKANPYRIEEES